jgi:flagellin
MGGSLSILNNVSSLMAENQLDSTQQSLNKTLQQLSSGSRINSGADDPAGLAIADGLNANVTALTQSIANANDGVGALQVTDGALSEVTNLLNRAVTLATESANGTLSSTQRLAIDNEFQSINTEINNIGTATTFNGASVFTASAQSIFMSDGSSATAAVTVATTTGTLSSTSIGGTATTLGSDNLKTSAAATSALADINKAITSVASLRGTLGANMNQLTAAVNVMTTESQNLSSASSTITSANIGEVVANMSQYQILQQTGMSALAQANSSQQAVLKLLQ